MDTTKMRTGFFVAVIFLFAIAAPVKADWDQGDSNKMHFPQLPDPTGWDIAYYKSVTFERIPLADDWLCTETGPVTDIHIWGSWDYDIKGEIESFNVSIWSDFPDNDGPGDNYSHPDKLLWQHTFFEDEFTERYWGNGPQRMALMSLSPSGAIMMGISTGTNHNDTWQYNLHIDPAMAFVQEEGTIYWLALSPQINSSEYMFGWKTSRDEWQDKAVYYVPFEDSALWLQLPSDLNQSFAFVINGPPKAPEVPTFTPIGLVALVGLLSALAVLTMRRKRL